MTRDREIENNEVRSIGLKQTKSFLTRGRLHHLHFRLPDLEELSQEQGVFLDPQDGRLGCPLRRTFNCTRHDLPALFLSLLTQRNLRTLPRNKAQLVPEVSKPMTRSPDAYNSLMGMWFGFSVRAQASDIRHGLQQHSLLRPNMTNPRNPMPAN